MDNKTNINVGNASLALAMSVQFPSSAVYTKVIQPIRDNPKLRNDSTLWGHCQDVYSAWRGHQDTPKIRESLGYLLNHLDIRSL